MAWAQRPTPRSDLVFEGRILLDASGNYDGGINYDWHETAGFNNLRLVVRFNNFSGSPTINVVEGMHVPDSDFNGGAFEMRSHSIALASGRGSVDKLPLTTRYFKFVITGGGANDYVYVTARSVN